MKIHKNLAKASVETRLAVARKLYDRDGEQAKAMGVPFNGAAMERLALTDQASFEAFSEALGSEEFSRIEAATRKRVEATAADRLAEKVTANVMRALARKGLLRGR